jgi:two-component system NarL family sensor kinase
MNYPLVPPQISSLSTGDSRHRPSAKDSPPHEDLVDCDTSFFLEPSNATVGELLRIHEYERQRMGQELHDSTGQLVVSLLLSLARLKRIEEDIGQGSIIDEIQETVRRIDKEIRALAFLHYPAELGDRGLSTSIERLALGFGRRSGMPVSFRCAGDAQHVDEPVAMALLRVTQEALVNVHRHSHATSARVELKSRPNRIELRISDDGVGMPEGGEATKTTGIGLPGMRHRIEAHGGRFEIRNLNPGLMVRASVPLAA